MTTQTFDINRFRLLNDFRAHRREVVTYPALSHWQRYKTSPRYADYIIFCVSQGFSTRSETFQSDAEWLSTEYHLAKLSGFNCTRVMLMGNQSELMSQIRQHHGVLLIDLNGEILRDLPRIITMTATPARRQPDPCAVVAVGYRTHHTEAQVRYSYKPRARPIHMIQVGDVTLIAPTYAQQRDLIRALHPQPAPLPGRVIPLPAETPSVNIAGLLPAPIGGRHIVSFSTGVPSAVTAYLVCQQYPDAEVWFADTLIEDADNYRFLDDLKALIGRDIRRFCAGLTPYEVADLEGYAFIPNQLSATCTRKLKIEPIMKACRAGDTIYIGYTHEDIKKGRGPAPVENYAKIGVTVRYPLVEQNILDPKTYAKSIGLQIPRMYEQGFPNANCGGECVRQGQSGWIRKLINDPDGYKRRERWEAQKRWKQAIKMVMMWHALKLTGAWQCIDLHKHRLYTLVRRVENGVNIGISLRDLRHDYEQNNKQPNFFQLIDDLSGLSCGAECGVGNGDELAQVVESLPAPVRKTPPIGETFNLPGFATECTLIEVRTIGGVEFSIFRHPCYGVRGLPSKAVKMGWQVPNAISQKLQAMEVKTG
jgi:3'-phosphoadenosine 5'-phosphosulfate sulfotransferase (PAPS reductase)/FAD synthetase